MSDPRIERLARVVIGYSLGLRKGDLVLIQAPSLAEPLVVELVRAALDAGANPAVRFSLPGVDHAYLSEATEEHLRFLLPYAVEEMQALDARIAVHAASNTRELSEIEPAKLRTRQDTNRPVMETYMQRSAAGELVWCVTAYPCTAFAQDAGMSLKQYEDFVFRAGWLHLADPVAAWKDFSRKLHEIVDRLKDVRELRVLAEGTDLTVGVAGRTWIAADGDRNFPDGEVFTGPEETRTRGDVAFSFPAIFGGREVDGVRLRFEDGRVVKSEALRGPVAAPGDALGGRRRFRAGRVRDRHQLQRRPLHEADPVRREDRRHVSHGGRSRLPGDGQHEHLRAALGHGVRSAQRR